MTNLKAAMQAVDAVNGQRQEVTREEFMFAVALNAQRVAILPRVLMTGHDIRQVRIHAQMLNDVPRAMETRGLEVVGDERVVSSKTLDHMADAVEKMNQQEA